jgi:DNA-binding transcriptional regulator YiaG
VLTLVTPPRTIWFVSGTATEKLTNRIAARRSLPPPEMRRAIRRAARASLQDVASAFEPPVSRHSVMAWERGTRSPGAGNIEQYVAILRALQGI